MFLKTYNTEFHDISVTFADQNGRPLEIEDKVNLTFMLLTNRNDTLFYRTKNKKICQRIWVFVIRKKSINKYAKQLLDTATKTELDAVKTASKIAVHNTVEATGKFIGNKIADQILKLKPVPDANSRNAE